MLQLSVDINALHFRTGPVAQSVGRPKVVSLILARPHTFVKVDYEIFSAVILHLQLIQERLLSVTRESMCTNYWLPLSEACPGKCVVRLNDHLYMIIAVDWDIKPQTKPKSKQALVFTFF